jgi:hypothetical protein
MFILLIDVDDDTRSVVFNDLSLHDTVPTGQGDIETILLPPLGGGHYSVTLRY